MFEPRAQNPAFAAALILTSTAFIAASTLLAKSLGTPTLGPPLHPFQISFGRFLFAFLTLNNSTKVTSSIPICRRMENQANSAVLLQGAEVYRRE